LNVLQKGKAYVELQTTQNPNGELRANLGSVIVLNQDPVNTNVLLRPPVDAPLPGFPTPTMTMTVSVLFSISPQQQVIQNIIKKKSRKDRKNS